MLSISHLDMGQQRCMGLRFCQDQGEPRKSRNQLGRHKRTVYHSKRDHSGVLHNNNRILKRTQQRNLQVLRKCNDISFGCIHVWNWSFFTQPHFEANKFYIWKCVHSRQKLPRDKTVCTSVFHVPIEKFYTWLNFLHNQRLWWMCQISILTFMALCPEIYPHMILNTIST